MSQVRARAARWIWGALPGDLAAEVIIRACGVPASSRRRVTVVDPGRSSVEVVLVVDPRLARYLDVQMGGIRPLAQTLGHHVLARGPLAPATVRHEAEHVRQWEALGPLFLPLYLLEAARVRLTGRHHYFANRFEVAARAREGADGVSGTESA
jgi:hypothetical protein